MKKIKFGILGLLVSKVRPKDITVFKFMERAVEGAKMPKIVRFKSRVFEKYDTGDSDRIYYVAREDDTTLMYHILQETEIESVNFLNEKITVILW